MNHDGKESDEDIDDDAASERGSEEPREKTVTSSVRYVYLLFIMMQPQREVRKNLVKKS